MSQNIRDIEVKKLVLWTENPRDPVDPNATDQEMADRAINNDRRHKWSLEKLFKSMGPRYDNSEIPTVVYVDRKPIVYDGNKRVLIGKIINGYVQVQNSPDFSKLTFPKVLPCNVCDLKMALEHVDRKHADSGSWGSLERDIFKHKHMKETPSAFLVIENETGLISSNPKLNQRFVKEEVFDLSTLRQLGFAVKNNKLMSSYNNKSDASEIFDRVKHLVEDGQLSTRGENRGKVLELLKRDNNTNKILDRQNKIPTKHYSINNQPIQENQRKTPITKKGKEHNLFGNKKLILKPGTVNNIYSDLIMMHKNKDKRGHSPEFPMLIRMGIRLLCELAAEDEKLKLDKCDEKLKLDKYISLNYEAAKKKLDQDEKRTLSSQNIKDNNIIEHIHSGAHGYTASKNSHQTIAISLIVGKMLEITHGK